MKRFIQVVVAVVGFCLLGSVASAGPHPQKAQGIKKHALAKVLMVPVKVVVAAPKAAGKGIAYTLGGVLFAAESGVDVVHLATDVLDKGVAAEGWKKNPFHYPNVVAGKVDTGLENGYEYFFHIQI